MLSTLLILVYSHAQQEVHFSAVFCHQPIFYTIFMFQPGFLGFCRNILLSYLPFIGGFVRVDFQVLTPTELNTNISSSNPALNKSDWRRIRPDYRPVKLFGKVVAINFW